MCRYRVCNNFGRGWHRLNALKVSAEGRSMFVEMWGFLQDWSNTLDPSRCWSLLRSQGTRLLQTRIWCFWIFDRLPSRRLGKSRMKRPSHWLSRVSQIMWLSSFWTRPALGVFHVHVTWCSWLNSNIELEQGRKSRCLTILAFIQLGFLSLLHNWGYETCTTINRK